jgi:hypothetical protein
MLIIFGSGDHWISKIIKKSTRSKWTHVGLVDHDLVIESIGPPFREYLGHLFLGIDYKKPYGVVTTQLNEFIARYQESEIRTIAGNIENARIRIGMPFDMLGLFCAYLHINWHDTKKDFCVETVSYAVEHIENHTAHQQRPVDIYWLSSQIDYKKGVDV